MRTILILLMCLIFVYACEEEKKAPEEPQQEMPAEDPEMNKFRENTETVKAAIEAFKSKDTTKLASYVSEDFIWSPPSVGMDSLSRRDWMEAMQGYMDKYDDIQLADALYYAGLDEDQNPNGDVRAYGVWESKHADSGKDAKLKWYAVYFFNDQGKIVHLAEWYDTADLQKEF